MALTADEEGGPDNGVAFACSPTGKELVDAEYAFNEGGGGRVKDGVRVSHDVQASEKKFQNFTFEATNPGGHSWVPVRDNAITHLSDALVKLGAWEFPVHLKNEVTRAYFTQLAAVTSGEMGAGELRAIVADPTNAAAARTLSADPRYNSQLRTTCVAAVLGGHATNALPSAPGPT